MLSGAKKLDGQIPRRILDPKIDEDIESGGFPGIEIFELKLCVDFTDLDIFGEVAGERLLAIESSLFITTLIRTLFFTAVSDSPITESNWIPSMSRCSMLYSVFISSIMADVSRLRL
jgi:hypothetical protein